ncbi:MAG: gliding motility protein GldL [Muribaculaceae bacterium]|nr:gliding motility protein GldL [Muribaculaceae bacterium]
MVKIRKYANGIERFLHGEKGQRFFNFAYSIGAAIVIWGALFKILHLPGGSTLLCIGMGTEIAMFILTAFDRPPKEYSWEEVFPVLDSKNPEDRPDFAGGGSGIIINGNSGNDGEYYNLEGQTGGGEGVSAGGGTGGALLVGNAGGFMADPAAAQSDVEAMADASKKYLEQIQGMAESMSSLNETTEALNNVTRTLLGSYEAITQNSETISANSQGYVDQMENLNRNIAGLNTIYEIQLKSISSQLESIDRVNRGLKDIRDMYDKAAHESSRYCEETERMARYMKQLNSVYEKMITAMTINMANPMMGGTAGAAPAQNAENPFDRSILNQNA